MLKLGMLVKVIDIEKTKSDSLLEENALKIMETSSFTGELTKIENGIYFVGFKNDEGWVTQGFKADEIKGVE